MPPTPESSTGLLIVTIDRLPAWIVSAWGATWVATPTIDAIAARGVVFDRVLTPVLEPRRIARDLARMAGGVATARDRSLAVVTDQADIVAAAGLEAGADVTVVPAAAVSAVARDAASTASGRLFAAAERVVASGTHRVVWCHVGSLGITWDAPHDFRERYIDPEDPPPPAGAAVPDMAISGETDPDLIAGLRHVFAGQVTLLDQCLGQLVQALPAADGSGAGWGLLMCGLRGMPLGIHDRLGGAVDPEDESLPYGEVVHVPAIIVDPAGRMATQRYGGLVTPADLATTVGDLVAETISPPPDDVSQPISQPISLASLFTSWQVRPRDRVVIRGARGDALATPGWHAIVRHAAPDAAPLLFAKPDDFFEICDVADREPAVADELARALRAGAGQVPDPAWQTPLSAAALTGAS